MKRGLFIILFLVLILFISGQQSCEPTISIGSGNTCCTLSTTTDSDYINNLAPEQCDTLFSIWGNQRGYYNSKLYEINLPNSCGNKLSYSDIVCPIPGNILLYHFEEGGASVIDSSGSEHTATKIGTMQTASLNADFGNALSFNGISDYVSSSVISTSSTVNIDYSISVWFRLADLVGTKMILHHATSSSDRIVMQIVDNSLRVGHFDGLTFSPKSGILSDTNWHNAIFVHDGATKTNKLYIDGVLQTGILSPGSDPGTGFTIGAYNLKIGFFKGQLDELIIWNKELSNIEVSAYYSKMKPLCVLVGEVSCIYNNNIYESGEKYCIQEAQTIYQCVNGKWEVSQDCSDLSGCINTKSCKNPSITTTACSDGSCGLSSCQVNCIYPDCANQGTDLGSCGLDSLCYRENTNGLPCTTGTCISGVCSFSSYPIEISSGHYHTCTLFSDGTIKCWGDNNFGQLGDGTNIVRYIPIVVPGITNVVSIGLGGQHTCAVISDGTVKCWGNNQYGQLGIGNMTQPIFTPVQVSGITNALKVVGGTTYTCALLSNGTIKCWGNNQYGQLGIGTITSSFIPVEVVGIANVVDIEIGNGHTCAVISDGTVKCWGRNNFGQLGDGTGGTYGAFSSVPVSPSGITNAVDISAGSTYTCAVISDGTVKCWGSNSEGELGDGSTIMRITPVQVSGITNAVSISVTGYAHSCVVNSNKEMYCWGNNQYGQLGIGIWSGTYTTPQLVLSGIKNAKMMALGDIHSCEINGDISNGNVYCWGSNNFGQLGIGLGSGKNKPIMQETGDSRLINPTL